MLTTIETVDTNKNNNLSKLAETKLNELNKIIETYSVNKILGDYRIGKGKLIPLLINDYNLIGDFLIKSATHNIDNKKELVNLQLEFYKNQ